MEICFMAYANATTYVEDAITDATAGAATIDIVGYPSMGQPQIPWG
jgi:hypothetical protein